MIWVIVAIFATGDPQRIGRFESHAQCEQALKQHWPEIMTAGDGFISAHCVERGEL